MKNSTRVSSPAQGYAKAAVRIITVTVTVAMALAIALSTPAGAGLLFGALQRDPPISPARLPQMTAGSATAIVILSAGRRTFAPEFGNPDNETVDALSLERIRYGAFLARRTGMPVLVSGGLGPVPLAKLMADTLSSDFGIVAKWIEPNAENTAENAIFSSRILKANGVQRVILVTHAWHMTRASAAFTANGMTVTAAPTSFYSSDPQGFLAAITPRLTTLNMSGYALHELVGGVWYRLRYGY